MHHVTLEWADTYVNLFLFLSGDYLCVLNVQYQYKYMFTWDS